MRNAVVKGLGLGHVRAAAMRLCLKKGRDMRGGRSFLSLPATREHEDPRWVTGHGINSANSDCMCAILSSNIRTRNPADGQRWDAVRWGSHSRGQPCALPAKLRPASRNPTARISPSPIAWLAIATDGRSSFGPWFSSPAVDRSCSAILCRLQGTRSGVP